MKIERYCKESFVVIGKQGSTLDGDGFIQKLWEDANAHFNEIAAYAKKDETGCPVGIWGAMSDFSLSFQPWEDFRCGLYLAGVECEADAPTPAGWVRWQIPGYEYLMAECDGDNTFSEVLQYMKDNHIALVGAVHDYTCPKTGKNYMLFPIRLL